MSKVVIKKREDAIAPFASFNNYDILIEGKNLKDLMPTGVLRIDVDFTAGKKPVLKIEMTPTEVEFEGVAEIITEKQETEK
ncbi:hypothetical protein [Bacillus paralicheniformis]|uniref:hypothetical protein n=1 Tax=Bacillus paralicheniformis TaxID=1648923 RepID=UPI001C0EC8FC|nr:hypothetical protein [Bacillus paralicheniformis]MBU5327640.1 hypothetical protein [Bacillus paralicheniformis]